MRYAINLTINTLRGEYERNVEAANLDTAMHNALRDYPDCTSVVMAIVPFAEHYPAKFKVD